MAQTTYLSAADVVFAEATPEQQKLAWTLNGVSWATPLSVPAYVEREAHMSRQPLTRDGRCRYWVLYRAGAPTEIVASCETTRKQTLIAGGSASSSSSNGDGDGDGGESSFRRGAAYAIASVYTNPSYRRMGMAALLLTKVQEFMDGEDEEGRPRSDFSVLYSDIGKYYYANLGWAVFPSEQATLHLDPLSTADPVEPGPNPPFPAFVPSNPAATRPLTDADLPALCTADEAALESRFRAIARSSSAGAGSSAAARRTHVAFLPSHEQIGWQLAREGFMARALFSGDAPRVHGAATTDGSGWAYWEHDWREKKLKVMRIVTPGPGDGRAVAAAARVGAVRALLEAALAEASKWGLRRVLVWNPDAETTVACKTVANAHEARVKVVLDERLDGSIPCLRWRGGKDTKNVVWEDNYYYCWC